MHAVILAAGRGTRMRPLPGACHKTLLPIGDRTILDRLVDGLAGLPVDALTLVVGHQGDAVTAAARRRAGALPLHVVVNDEYSTTNNVVSLALALAHVPDGEEVLVLESDLVLGPGLLERVCAGPERNVALVDRFGPDMDGTAVTVDRGVITAIVPKGEQGPTFARSDTYKTVNVYRFSAAFRRATLDGLLAAHPERDDFYESALARLPDLAGAAIAVELTGGAEWAEVDDPVDLAAARFRFAPAQRAAILDQARGGHWSFPVLDFSFMANAYFPTAPMLEALRDALPELVGGYGSTQAVVDEKLAWLLGRDPAEVLTLHGAAQAYPILQELWAGRRVTIPAPTFGEYARTFPQARTYADVPGAGVGDLDALAAESDVLVVVTPNNPTGTTLASADLLALAARHPDTTLLVDESFVAFSDEPPLLGLLAGAPRPNVVILTSLSKSLGVPGVRLGFLASGDAELLAAIAARLPIWNLSAMAERLIELTAKEPDALDEALRRTRADREALRRGLVALDGVRAAHPGGGNFVLVDLDGPPGTVAALRERLLAEEAIEIKDVTDRFGDGVARMRVAARPAGDAQRLLAALERHLGAARAAAGR